MAQFADEPTRVRQLVAAFLTGQSGSEVGPGNPAITLAVGADRRDDCAVFDIGGSVSLVFGSDYVRGSKFRLYELGLLSDFDIGYYLVAANVSDVAAMGATPIGVCTVVRYPPDLTDERFRSVMAGIHQACTDFGTLNVGGDIGNAERLILSASAIGVCAPGKVLTRGGAKPGDVLCVTGPCGLLGAAVAYFPKREEKGWQLPEELEKRLLGSWKRPVARVAEGRLLAAKPYATACQDTSDGLKATIEQIAEASGVGFDVTTGDVPLDETVAAVAEVMGVGRTALAMSASADFQLAFTVGEQDLDACRADFLAHGLDLYAIGRATDAGEVRAVGPDGSVGALPGVAWKHQQSDISLLVSDSSEGGSAPPRQRRDADDVTSS
ncbi:thiamine-phosphate kinase [Micromonospora zhanjiangensis]|uniref:Thiamine-monophosphate kinase n=1 Tax=Micromonospora zhanjiangensis TaxID=1522057 RepID=A0ABV8KTT8_9ACTN